MESFKHFISITKLLHYLLGTDVAAEPQDNLSSNLADLTPVVSTIAICIIKHLGTLNIIENLTYMHLTVLFSPSKLPST